MRILSGNVTTYLYFIAVDATDRVTREAGLSSFTVARSRNGAADAAFTTPTITEIDAAAMPGVYALLVDEDTTLDAGFDEQEVCLHITHAGMAPVTRTFTLSRAKATAGNTLGVESNGDLTKVNTLDGVAANGSGFTALPWNAAWDAEVQSEVDDALIVLGLDHLVSASVAGADVADNSIVARLASKSATADWDSFNNTTDALEAIRDVTALQASLSGVATQVSLNAFVASTGEALQAIDDYIDFEVAAIKAKTDNLPSDPADASVIAAAFAALESHGDGAWATATGFSTLDAAAVRAAVGLAAANLDTQLADLPTNAEHAAAIMTALATGLTEGYRASGAVGSVRDLLYEILAHVGEFAITGTTKQLKQIDGVTNGPTCTLNDATNPTAIGRTA